MFQYDLEQLIFHCAFDLSDIGKNGAAFLVLDVHLSEEQIIEDLLLVNVFGSQSHLWLRLRTTCLSLSQHPTHHVDLLTVLQNSVFSELRLALLPILGKILNMQSVL